MYFVVKKQTFPLRSHWVFVGVNHVMGVDTCWSFFCLIFLSKTFLRCCHCQQPCHFVAVLVPTHTKCSGLLCRSSGKDIVLVSGATNTSIASAATVAAAVHADDVVVFGINVAILFCCYCYSEYDGVISGSCQIAYRIFP